MVELGEHYRPVQDESADSGENSATPIYRVVGTTEETALLRVTDSDGRRAHTGELRHVAPDALATEFESAADPDTGLSPVAEVRNLLSGLYWSVRRFF